MYSVSLLDIVFACIMCALFMLLCYAIGRTNNNTSLNKKLTAALARKAELNRCWYETRAKLIYANGVIEDLEGVHKLCMDMAIKAEQRELPKKHREAMKKYKARCNAKLARQVDLIDKPAVEHIKSIGPAVTDDFSYLLSK